jgi:hypothetical protein
MGPLKVLDRLQAWQQRFGRRFDPAPTLRELAQNGRRSASADPGNGGQKTAPGRHPNMER